MCPTLPHPKKVLQRTKIVTTERARKPTKRSRPQNKDKAAVEPAREVLPAAWVPNVEVGGVASAVMGERDAELLAALEEGLAELDSLGVLLDNTEGARVLLGRVLGVLRDT